jgi:hypothetical protein
LIISLGTGSNFLKLLTNKLESLFAEISYFSLSFQVFLGFKSNGGTPGQEVG